MQSRCYKTILTLFVQSAVFLALSIPATGYTDNSVGSSSGYRSSHGISSGHRGLAKGHRVHSTHRLNSRNSRFAAIKQKNSVGSTSGNRSSQRLSSRSHNLNKSHRPQSLSRHERNHKQRENVDSHNKQGHSNHNNRLGTVGQQIINGRNKRFKTQNNPGLPASNLKNRLIRKNLGLTKSIKSQVNSKQIAAIKPGKIRRNVVTTNPLKRFKRHKASGQHGSTLDKKGTVFQTHHKQHNSHSRHNQKRHHGHHKQNRHFTRSIFSPFVFFSYSSHYYPYSYYPYAYPFYRSYGYSSPAYSYEEPVYSTSKPYGIDSPGWTYFAWGNFQAAINVFAKDIQSFPDAGIPKVGFALATAAAGNMTESVLAMREAFNVDPDSIRYIYFDEKVLPIIDDLIEKYEYVLQQSNKRPDEAFMVSALHYLRYDYGSAHEAINRAITDGDKSLSLGKLHRLVDEQFPSEYADKDN